MGWWLRRFDHIRLHAVDLFGNEFAGRNLVWQLLLRDEDEDGDLARVSSVDTLTAQSHGVHAGDFQQRALRRPFDCHVLLLCHENSFLIAPAPGTSSVVSSGATAACGVYFA